MAARAKAATQKRGRPVAAQADMPQKPWGRDAKTKELNKRVMDNLYRVASSLNKDTRLGVGLMMELPIFPKDPLVAREHPELSIKQIGVRLEAELGDGPTSSRLAVVDYNADTQTLLKPVKWVKENGWFRTPDDGWLPDIVQELAQIKRRTRDPDQRKAAYLPLLDAAVSNPYFHQVSLWATVQHILEFYEDAFVLGRPVPWGFNGNRLILVPHAGYGENAFYDRASKSLQFYYFGDPQNPGYTCLSHDIVAHETGHAILDGIRPLYQNNPSIQTAAFHEFVGDLTALLLALSNQDIRSFVAKTAQEDLDNTANSLPEATQILANLAAQFGREVEDRAYLRTAYNQASLRDPGITSSLSPHNVSQVLTGAVFEVFLGIAGKYMAPKVPDEETIPDEDSPESPTADAAATQKQSKVTYAMALKWATQRIRQIALQALDLCPPCDIQFLDYARAVIRNDVLTNPQDPNDYRGLMLEVFHRRGLCGCPFVAGQDLPQDCQFQQALYPPRLELVTHDIGRVARSRTAAYYFLSDNRAILHIPPQQDVVVTDLYDNSKYDASARRLPRQVILEYTWQEEIELKDDPAQEQLFGRLNGKRVRLDCGGTLVFDDRGNLLSWFSKPGVQHLSAVAAAKLQQRLDAWQSQSGDATTGRGQKLTLAEKAALGARVLGQARIDALLSGLVAKEGRGLIGLVDGATAANLPRAAMKPVTAVEEDRVIRFTTTPHLREADLDKEDEGWLLNY